MLTFKALQIKGSNTTAFGKLLSTINQSHPENTDYSADMKNKTVSFFIKKKIKIKYIYKEAEQSFFIGGM